MTPSTSTAETQYAARASSVLEFNDAQLRLHQFGLPVQLSGVLAVADGNTVRVGDLAAGGSYIDARFGCDTYLSQLGGAVIGLRNAPHLTSADLLFAHLGQFVGETTVDTFVVAPTFQPAQLSLLLGVAIRAGLQPTRLLDAAVAAAAVATAPGEHAYYLDLGRTGSMLAEVRDEHSAVIRGAVSNTSGTGLGAGRELWLRWIRERCVALWRIDPMFNPDSAANIVAAWPAARDALARREGGTLHIGPERQLDWVPDELLLRLQQAQRAIVDATLANVPDGGILLLDARLSELPGLTSTLARYRDTRLLSVDALAHAARASTEPSTLTPRAAASGVPHVLELPRMAAPRSDLQQQTQPPTWTTVSAAPCVTQHLIIALGSAAYSLAVDQPAILSVRMGDSVPLWQATASSIEPDALQLRLRAAADHVLLEWSTTAETSGLAVQVNGRPALPRTVVRAGDSVRIGQCTPFAILQLLDVRAPVVRTPSASSGADDGR